MSDRLQLSPRHRHVLKDLVREHLPDTEVWAYGSRGDDRGHEGSDLDLVLRGPGLNEISCERLTDFGEAIRESTIPFRVQVRDWARLSERFRREVEAEYVAVAEATANGDSRWVALADIIDLTLSSVDKKTKPGEQPVRLCNYMDVYYNTFITDQLDFMVATATDHEVDRCGLARGDVIITKDSEKHDDIGVPALVRHDVADLVCGYHLAILRPRPARVEGAYLVYALSAPQVQHQFHAYANGITRFGLRKGDIGLVEVPLPSLLEQRAIAHILGTLDDKIEVNRRMNETLEAMVHALFKSWFVDFDPVRAKMEGRYTGLPQDIADLFPDRMVDSDMGKIPEGWSVTRLGDVAALRRQGIDPASVASDTPYIGLADMPRGSIALPDWGETGSVSSRKSAFKAGDILFGKLRPYFHKVGIAPVDGLCSTDIVVLGARRPTWFALVLACVSSSAFVAHTSQTATGTKMPRTSWKAMSSYKLCRPTDTLATEFQRLVAPILRRIVGNIHESRSLSLVRDRLLPNIMSGQIRLADAERAMKAKALR